MKRYIKSSTDQANKLAMDYVQDRVADGLDEGTAFIDGDTFAYCLDEECRFGSISKLAQAIATYLNDGGSTDLNDIGEMLYDNDLVESTYSLSQINKLFRSHGVQLPDWYFD